MRHDFRDGGRKRKDPNRYSRLLLTLWKILFLATTGGCLKPHSASTLPVAGELTESSSNTIHSVQLSEVDAMRPQVDPARVPSPQSGIPGLPIGHLLNEKTDDDFAARLEAVRAEAFAQGRKVGEAEAAAKNFERGLAIGKEQGLSEGRTNAVEANRLATELAVNEAVADTELITRLKTVDEVRQAERLRDMTDSNLPVYFLGTVLVCLMFFILARMDRGRSRNADVQAEHYREFINQIFDVAADFLRRDADRSGTPRNLPPPVNSGDDRFKLGEGR